MEEVGIYRVSGVATDIQALKAAFDSSEFNPKFISFQKSDLIKVDDTKGRDWQDRPCSGDFERLLSVFFSNLCTMCPAQTTRTYLS